MSKGFDRKVNEWIRENFPETKRNKMLKCALERAANIGASFQIDELTEKLFPERKK